MNEDEALNDIMGEIYGEEVAPAMEEAPQEVIQEEVPQEIVEEVPPEATQEEVPEVIEETPTAPVDSNKEMIAQLMESQAAAIEQNKELIAKLDAKDEVIAELSEEDQAMQDLKDRLGLNKIEEENQLLREQLQQITSQNEQRAEQEQQMVEQQRLQEEIKTEADKFVKEYPDVQPEKIMDYIKGQPAQMQQQLDTPNGWRIIAHVLRGQAQVTQVPDAMTSTQSTPTVRSASSERRAGKDVSDMAIVEELLSFAQ